MVTRTTFRQARDGLDRLCESVADEREIVIIARDDARDVALISAADLAAMMEMLHVLSLTRRGPVPELIGAPA